MTRVRLPDWPQSVVRRLAKEQGGRYGQWQARLLQAAYKRRLRVTAGDRCEPVDVGDRRRL